jgi:hypothetical protein
MILGDDELDRRESPDRADDLPERPRGSFCNQNGHPAIGEKNFV